MPPCRSSPSHRSPAPVSADRLRCALRAFAVPAVFVLQRSGPLLAPAVLGTVPQEGLAPQELLGQLRPGVLVRQQRYCLLAAEPGACRRRALLSCGEK